MCGSEEHKSYYLVISRVVVFSILSYYKYCESEAKLQHTNK